MVKQNEHGRWFVEGTRKLWPTKRQALMYAEVTGVSAPLMEEVEPASKKRWWSR